MYYSEPLDDDVLWVHYYSSGSHAYVTGDSGAIVRVGTFKLLSVLDHVAQGKTGWVFPHLAIVHDNGVKFLAALWDWSGVSLTVEQVQYILGQLEALND